MPYINSLIQLKVSLLFFWLPRINLLQSLLLLSLSLSLPYAFSCEQKCSSMQNVAKPLSTCSGLAFWNEYIATQRLWCWCLSATVSMQCGFSRKSIEILHFSIRRRSVSQELNHQNEIQYSELSFDSPRTGV